MEQDQDYTESAAKTFQENLSSFSRVRKNVCGHHVVVMEDHAPVDQFWAFLLKGLPQTIELLVSIWWHRWFGSLGATHNKPLF